MEEEEGAASIERVEKGTRKVAVQTKGLRKVYPGGRTAVDGLDLTVYDGQVKLSSVAFRRSLSYKALIYASE